MRSFLKKIAKIFAAVLFGLTNFLVADWDFASTSSVFNLSSPTAKIILEQPIESFKGTINTYSTESCDQIISTTDAAFISFSQGCLKNPVGSCNFTGKLVTSFEEPHILASGSMVDVKENICTPLQFLSAGNRLTGSPLLDHDIVLTDTTTSLEIGITNKLDKNIILNGGMFKLLKDLALKEGVTFVGNGTVDLGNFTLKMPENFNLPWNGNLTFLNASDLTAKHPLTVSGNWSFEGENKKSSIYGQGNNLNLESGGTLTIGPNHILELSNLYIKGLGGLNGGKIIISPTGTLVLTNTVLELVNNLEINSGQIIINSEDCRIISKNSAKLILDGPSTNLIINGHLLKYDSLNNPGQNPVQCTNSASITKVNGGEMIAGMQASINPNINFYQSSTFGNNSISSNLDLSSNKVMSFNNEYPNTRKTMVFDAQNNKINFTKNDSANLIIVGENIDLTIINAVFEDFEPSKFLINGSAGSLSKIYFGDNVTFKISKDISLQNFPLNIVGNNVQINGIASKIEFFTGSIKIEDNKSLVIANCQLKLSENHPFSEMSPNSTLTIQNSDIFVSNPGCYFEEGQLNLSGIVKFYGFDASDSVSNSKFIFASNKNCLVKSSSTLIIEQGVTFVYEPDLSLDTSTSQNKRHFLFEDSSAKMIISSATFDTGSTGLALDSGTINIIGNCLFKIPNNFDAALELGQSLNLIIASDAIMMVDGPVVYS